MTELIDQEFSFHSFSLSSSARGKLMWQSLLLFLCSSVGVRHHERCRLLLHLCFPVKHGSKVKGHPCCSGTFGNARANPYLQIPVVRSQEDPHCLTLIWRELIWSMLTWLCTCSVLWTSKGMILPLTLGHLHRDKWLCSFCLWSMLMHLVTAVPALRMKSLEWPPSVPLRSAHHKPTIECYGKFMGELSIKY